MAIMLKNTKLVFLLLLVLGLLPDLGLAAPLLLGVQHQSEQHELIAVAVSFGQVSLGRYLVRLNDSNHTLVFNRFSQLFEQLQDKVKPQYQALIRERLASALQTNSDRACDGGQNCRYVVPQSLSIVFNPKSYQVGIFINPKFLKRKRIKSIKYLDDSSAGLSSINQFDNNLVGGNKSNTDYSFTHHLILGYQNWDFHIADNFTYNGQDEDENKSATHYYTFQDFYARYRKNHLMVKAGLQDTVGTLIIPQFKIIGISLETQPDLISNYDSQIATPIEVSLLVPSYVEIYVGKRLITTQYYSQGNHYLDTGLLPSGAYLLRLKIRSANGEERSREVYFVKTDALPLYNLPGYYISYGRISSLSNTHVIPELSSINSLNLSAEQRLHKFFGVAEHGVLVNNNEAIGELEFISQLPKITIINSVAASNFGDYGLGLVLSGELHKVSISTIFRKVWANDNADSDHINDYIKDSENASTSIGTNIGYNLFGTDINIGLGYGFENEGPTHFSSLGINHNFVLSSNASLDVNFSVNLNHDKNSAFLAFTLNFANPHGFDWSAGVEGESIKDKEKDIDGTSNKLKFNAGASRHFDWGQSENYYAANISSDWNSRYLSQFASTQTPAYNASVQTTLTQGKDGTNSLYNLKAASSYIYTADGHSAFSSSTKDSGVMLYVQAPTNSTYDVLLDGQPSLSIASNQSYFLPLPSFRRYQFELFNQSNGFNVLNPERNIVLYDGNVASLNWQVQQPYSLSARFVDSTGRAVVDAGISGGLEFTKTDDNGFAKVLIHPGSVLVLTQSDGEKCQVSTTMLKPTLGTYMNLNSLVCLSVLAKP